MLLGNYPVDKPSRRQKGAGQAGLANLDWILQKWLVKRLNINSYANAYLWQAKWHFILSVNDFFLKKKTPRLGQPSTPELPQNFLKNFSQEWKIT